MRKSRLPNLFICGVNKGGTTALHRALGAHPEIASGLVKEACYFLAKRYGELLPAIEEYSNNYVNVGSQNYILDSTPGYFYGGVEVAQSISEVCPDYKAIVVLRNPSDRLISFFRFMKSMMELTPETTLEGYIRDCLSMPYCEVSKRENNRFWGLEGGHYIKWLPQWNDHLGERLRVFFFDQLKADPQAVLSDIAAWLDIDPTPFLDVGVRSENRTIAYANGSLHKFGLFVNKKLESFWTYNPSLKRALRNIYYKINESDVSEMVADNTLRMIDDFYAPSNRALAKYLSSARSIELPSWLR